MQITSVTWRPMPTIPRHHRLRLPPPQRPHPSPLPPPPSPLPPPLPRPLPLPLLRQQNAPTPRKVPEFVRFSPNSSCRRWGLSTRPIHVRMHYWRSNWWRSRDWARGWSEYGSRTRGVRTRRRQFRRRRPECTNNRHCRLEQEMWVEFSCACRFDFRGGGRKEKERGKDGGRKKDKQ